MAKLQYNCSKCPAYCCTYDHIEVTARDLRRLAKHHDLSEKKARKKFTKKGDDGARVMRHKKDHHFGTACVFLDPEGRGCTIYEARPKICREYPGTRRCGFYDFLRAERKSQDDPEYVPDFTR